MFKSKKIVIIGSGWLSWPLARHLNQLGHQVIATTTDTEKAQRLSNESVKVIQLISNNAQRPEILDALKDCEIMVIAIPPKRQQNDYFNQLQQLLKLAEKLKITNILFISSTSVYGDQSGILTEGSGTQAKAPAAGAMAQFEQLLLSPSGHNNSVLRLAGLIDSQRHPGRFFAGKTAVANPAAVVNMIHQTDCIGLITSIIMQNAWGEVLLGCAPSHPTRHEFYRQGASALGLEPPQFVESGGENSKLIDASHSAERLSYDYQQPNLLKWLNSPRPQ